MSRSKPASGEINPVFQLTLQQSQILQYFLPKSYSFQLLDETCNQQRAARLNRFSKNSSYQFLDPNGEQMFIREFYGKKLSTSSKKSQNKQDDKMIISPNKIIVNQSKQSSLKSIDSQKKVPNQNSIKKQIKEKPQPQKKAEPQKILQLPQIQQNQKKDLKICSKILQKLKRHDSSWPFLEPVDPINQQVPNYLQIVQQPMDLKTVQKNLRNQQYRTLSDFQIDIYRIISNSYKFNPKDSVYFTTTITFQKQFLKYRHQCIKQEQNSIKTEKIQNEKKEKIQEKIQEKIKQQKPINSKAQSGKGKSLINTKPHITQIKQLIKKISSLGSQEVEKVLTILYDEDDLPVKEQYQIQLANLSLTKFRELETFVLEKQKSKKKKPVK